MLAQPFKTLLLLLGLLSQSGEIHAHKTENVILVTSDGLRWQEVFQGLDPEVAALNDEWEIPQELFHKDPLHRRRTLMPFIWNTIAKDGVLLGNQALQSYVTVTNHTSKSFPGYNEIVTGLKDDYRVVSNFPRYNQSGTFLEFLDHQTEFNKKVGTVASWWAFHFLVNQPRSQLLTQAGPAPGQPHLTPQPDRLTHENAMAFLIERQPRVAFIAYDDTDNLAHKNDYPGYLNAARQYDAFVQEIWTTLQSIPQYKDKTTLILSTDHGRGIGKKWNNHGKKIDRSNEIWIAAMGPDTPSLGEAENHTAYLNQIASTCTSLLGFDYALDRETGKPIDLILEKGPTPIAHENANQTDLVSKEQLHLAAVRFAKSVVKEIEQELRTPYLPNHQRAVQLNHEIDTAIKKLSIANPLSETEYQTVLSAIRQDPALNQSFISAANEFLSKPENKKVHPILYPNLTTNSIWLNNNQKPKNDTPKK